MNKKKIFNLIVLLIIIFSFVFLLNDTFNKKDNDLLENNVIISDLEKFEISENEIQGLIQMREEEKLARDVYTTLGEIWGAKIFYNIASSEQNHIDMVKTLFVKYGIEDTIVDDKKGVFTLEPIQELYNDMIKKGEKSLLDALIVGANIEDLDIEDLENFKKETKNSDILAVYDNLQRGSYNHMRAFVKNIKMNGADYSPVYISQSEYDLIISGKK